MKPTPHALAVRSIAVDPWKQEGPRTLANAVLAKLEDPTVTGWVTHNEKTGEVSISVGVLIPGELESWYKSDLHCILASYGWKIESMYNMKEGGIKVVQFRLVAILVPGEVYAPGSEPFLG